MKTFKFAKKLALTTLFLPFITLACDESTSGKKLLLDKITPQDFNVVGYQTRGKLELKPSKVLAPELEMRYFRGKTSPSSDEDYSSIAIENLINNNTVWIKLFVKNEMSTSFEINSNPIMIVISGLKTLITRDLQANDLTIVGNIDMQASLELNKAIVLQDEIEIRYALSDGEPFVLTQYQPQKLTNLSNGTVVWARLFIKDAFLNEFAISTKALQITISNLKTRLVNELKITDFRLEGTDGNATLLRQSTVAIPEALEIRYYKGIPGDDTEPLNLNLFDDVQNQYLSINDVVWARLFIKSGQEKDYVLQTRSLKIVVNQNLMLPTH